MTQSTFKLPKILVIDDVYGQKSPNWDRENFCCRLGMKDVTPDLIPPQKNVEGSPATIANAVFCSGQILKDKSIENDIAGVLDIIASGYNSNSYWAMILLDLHFKTGPITDGGSAKGRETDRDPKQYFGLKILDEIKKVFPIIPVIVISGMDRADIEEELSEKGACGFVDRTELNKDKLREFLWENGLLEDCKMIGASLPMLLCMREVRRAVKIGNNNILILGETGTGKELMAEYAHRVSPKSEGPFKTLFTQGVPGNIIEDTLFGHEKGAFTGADVATNGIASEADGGTLFIDEFGDIPAGIQAKLLRLLDPTLRECTKIGAHTWEKLNLQIVMATNRIDIIDGKDFRNDLLARTEARVIFVPPLRERTNDIEKLCSYFVTKFEESIGAEQRNISGKVIEVFRSYHWSKNIRELENIIKKAVEDYPSLRILSLAHIPEHLRKSVIESKLNKVDPVFDFRNEIIGDKTLSAMLKEISKYKFSTNHEEIFGRLSDIREAFAFFFASYIKAALTCPANKKYSTTHPEGVANYTIAMKCITGEDIATSKAYDIIKKYLQIDDNSLEEIKKDPVLGPAYGKAVESRPKNKKK